MLIIRKEAEEDIEAAYEWYEKQRINLGGSFIEDVDAKLEEIEERPDLYIEISYHPHRAD